MESQLLGRSNVTQPGNLSRPFRGTHSTARSPWPRHPGYLQQSIYAVGDAAKGAKPGKKPERPARRDKPAKAQPVEAKPVDTSFTTQTRTRTYEIQKSQGKARSAAAKRSGPKTQESQPHKDTSAKQFRESRDQSPASSAAMAGSVPEYPEDHQYLQVEVGLHARVPTGGPAAVSKAPEVLAPAGGWPQLRAAVENGADAVYFGLTLFNARARANNFTPEELEEVMRYLRVRGVKGFVTLNTLIFDEELPEVEAYIRHISQCGVDAVIVQDWAVVEMIRRIAPALPIHASTQMSVTSAEGAAFAGRLGVERVVVGRELSIRDMAQISSRLATLPGEPPELEAFVHGALCVSYSGQCFSSEAWGGRSANRGQCAQACRLPYGLIVDGRLRELADFQYLLSPQDLIAVDLVPELVRAGVACFKIEGRLKGPEYVAVTTRVYRQAVDAAMAALAEPDQGLGGATAADRSHPAATLATRPQTSLPNLARASLLAQAHSGAVRSSEKKLAGEAAAVRDVGPGQLAKGIVQGIGPLEEPDQAPAGGAVPDKAAADVEPAGEATVADGRTPGLDVCHPSGSGGLANGDLSSSQILADSLQDLQQVFARGQDEEHRGLTHGFLEGSRHQQLVRGRSPRHRGVYVGCVTMVSAQYISVLSQVDIKPGDGLVFDSGNPQLVEPGGTVFRIKSSNPLHSSRQKRKPTLASELMESSTHAAAAGSCGRSGLSADNKTCEVQLEMRGDGFNFEQVKVGDRVWRSRDAALERRLRDTFEDLPASQLRRFPVHLRLWGRVGQAVHIEIRDSSGRTVTVRSKSELEPAKGQPLTLAAVSEAIGQLGDTPSGQHLLT
eukprot:jgi/Botrbrau1/22191/Bobra.168_1s0023.1